MSEQEIVLSDVAIEIDDEAITVAGNSISLVEGQGIDNVTSAFKGGRTVTIHSQDGATRVGKIKFSTPSSIASANLLRDIKARGPGRTVRVFGIDSFGNRFGRTMTNGVLMSDPEKAFQNDGKIEVEFAGSPLAIS